MPKVKRSRKPPPDGWELIEPTLDELDQKMREAETEPHEGKRKVESLWPIFRLHHQRSRYIFDLFYKRKAISRELYDYCIKEGYADKNLIAKWKKQGYENLCCLRCIQTRDTNFGTNCICRVPKSKLEVGRIIECTHCGCRGCSGWAAVCGLAAFFFLLFLPSLDIGAHPASSHITLKWLFLFHSFVSEAFCYHHRPLPI